MTGRVLLIDEETTTREELEHALRQHGLEVTVRSDAASGLALTDKSMFDVLICNVNLSPIGGLELLKRCQAACPETMVIMMAAEGTIEFAVEAMKAGAYDFLTKPLSSDRVVLAAERGLERNKLMEDNARFREELGSKYDFGQIIGSSAAIRSVLERVKRIVDTKSTVLITGKSGSGKELIAKAIHYNSARRHRPMITVNCGSIPYNLLESELFGHVKGAFTGAVSSKKGLFEEANQSTLFLDEIGEMILDLQVKILRAIEDEEIRRIGDNQKIKLDVRIIAATNKDLGKAVEEGRFRGDLYYRLNVVSLSVPPLRERREDIPLLAQFFLEKYKRKHNREIQGITEDSMRALIACDWPGNVRELDHVIEQAVIMTDEPWIKIKDLSCLLTSGEQTVRVSIPFAENNLKSILRKVSAEAEKELITRVLQECAGNRTHAARTLGISRRALLYKVKQLGLNSIAAQHQP